ncbi:OsmC family protein [Halpernia frigidisoli]|uniref:Putative redox protein n=1 Tax=Halpernia frigidisoli TaxID=1125876 RepID=A0A1I3GN03_9FLAO|nr:OsmC family protein [Halpernia frigidisoli]SFI24671.1 putative redox protein [Halpernia frigidisoli]
MKIKIDRKNKAYHFQGQNEDGVTINMDANPEIGGEKKGVRPMEMLLYGLAGCSAIDMISILEKSKQDLQEISVEVDAERQKDKTPALFTDIKVTFYLSGNLDETKVKRALDLTFEKYCSVALTLNKTAKITYDYVINN